MGEIDPFIATLAKQIEDTQRRARSGRADALRLAMLVFTQLERAGAMAQAAGTTVERLHLTMHVWDGPPTTQITTLVEVTSFPRQEIRIRRAVPPCTVRSGALSMLLEPEGAS